MTVPRTKTEEELAQKIQERLLSTRAHSSLKESQVQELMMSYLTKTVQDKFRREDIFQMTMHDAYREGEMVALRKTSSSSQRCATSHSAPKEIGRAHV